ncbi:MAG: EF-P lysine aminoacylase GenX [Magnetococcales bacterium]|nr:EF-P lysine aminoacylase GenX [Magnetococcales bacterium]
MWNVPNPDWRPGPSIEALRRRAEWMRQVRSFFEERGLLEVETPLLVAALAPEIHIDPVSCASPFPGDARPWYLLPSPEVHMKRLLAAGSGAVFQISRCFRRGEWGQHHNPEFTMLEWYRPGWDLEALMEEVCDLIRLFSPQERFLFWSFREAFQEFADLDPFEASPEEMRARLPEGVPSDLDREALWDLLLNARVEPALHALDAPVLLTAFPASRAGMSRILPGEPPLAQRFELYWRGLELANGYQELTDASQQAQRLQEANLWRGNNALPPLPVDGDFLQALQAGMPECAGVAVGLDRLFMALERVETIGEIMAFTSHPPSS